jgi:hypothetical protein
MALPDVSGGCQPAGGERLLIAGASSPDWGPADVPSATPAPPPSSQLTVAVKRAKLRAALRNGLVVTVRGATGRVTATALKGRTKVGGGRAASQERHRHGARALHQIRAALARAQALGAADDPHRGGRDAQRERDAQTSVS